MYQYWCKFQPWKRRLLQNKKVTHRLTDRQTDKVTTVTLMHARWGLIKYVMVWNRMQKYVPLVKQNVMKLEVIILDKELIRRERRDWRGRRERIEKGSRERIEIERKQTNGNWVNNLKRRTRNIDTCLCLLFSFLKALRFSWVHD